MNSLFSIFDPKAIFNLNLNWIISFMLLLMIPNLFWVTKSQIAMLFKNLFSYLSLELKMNLGKINSAGASLALLSLFTYVGLMNLLGLLPYIFTPSSHLVFTLSFGLMVWLISILSVLLKDINFFLTHLVPAGTPSLLIPLMVLIETVSNIIRPITLSVRLAANMVAGHLLLSLISGAGSISNFPLLFAILMSLVLMVILESAVAIIQSYVLTSLSSIYMGEVNTVKLWN